MNIERVDAFLYQSVKIRYGIISSLWLVALFMIYLWVVMPINEQYSHAQFDHQSLVDDLTLLVKKIAHYPSLEQLHNDNTQLQSLIQRTALTSGNVTETLAKWLLNSRLKLIDFSDEEGIDQIRLQLRLQGTYQDFMMFITRLSQQKIDLEVKHILINHDKNHLIFSLLLISQHQRVK